MTWTVPDEAALRRWLIDYLVTEIGCDRDDVDVEVALNDLGVGSRDAVSLSGDLSELLGRPVSPLELWQHPHHQRIGEIPGHTHLGVRAGTGRPGPSARGVS